MDQKIPHYLEECTFLPEAEKALYLQKAYFVFVFGSSP